MPKTGAECSGENSLCACLVTNMGTESYFVQNLHYPMAFISGSVKEEVKSETGNHILRSFLAYPFRVKILLAG